MTGAAVAGIHLPVPTPQDWAGLAALIADFGETHWICHTARGWQATPKRREQDILRAAGAGQLRARLERDKARREMPS